MGIYLIISFIIGGALGIGMYFLSGRLIKKRTNEQPKGFLFENKYRWIIWALIGAIGSIIITLINGDILKGIEYIAIYMVLVCLSVVDGSIRKIPNDLLVMLIVFKLAAVGIRGEWSTLLPALYGLIIGWVLFVIPSMLGMSIGWGDVKLAAVSGFYLGIIGLIQAVLIMGVVLGIYGVYLMISKKGTLKTKVAIGPPLSLGIFISLLYPLAAVIQI